jgi:hypothetical protein
VNPFLWRPLSVALLVATLTGLCPARSSVAASGPLPDSLTDHRLSGSLNMYYSYPIPDEATALALAQSHSILVGNSYLMHGYGPEMQAANPSLLIFQYYDGVYSKETKFPESWYLHDAAGNRLVNEVPMYLMDPLSNEAYTEGTVTYVGWRGWVTRQCLALLAASPGLFNGGCWLDNIGSNPVNGRVKDVVTGLTEPPINPAKGLPYTNHEWYQITGPFARKVRVGVGGYSIDNALVGPGSFYAGSEGTRQFLKYLAGGMAEAWLRGARDPVTPYPTILKWTQAVQMIMDTNRSGHAIQCMLKLWTTATPEQVDAWRRFAFATYLMGNQGAAYFQFSSAPLPAMPWADLTDPLFDVPIGSPMDTYAKVGKYAKAGGAYYQRMFTGGLVLINPNPTGDEVTVQLGGTYYLPDGTAVTQVALPQDTAQIVTTTPP